MSKTALIVDDSRSARVVLKKMLLAHDLVVDTAESAEDALLYLNDHRPDVIFMDHLMPGMDGFEAVSAIKNNPDTATIPIMMYTSQEGELYVGQARALGAVGVLPKQIEPVEVSKVLQSLRVIGGEDSHTAPTETSETESSGEFPGLETLDQDLRLLIQDLFDQQRAVIRRDLLDSYETIAARVADEIRPADEEDIDAAKIPDRTGVSKMFQVATVALVLTSMVFAWLYWQREQSWQVMQSQFSNMQQELSARRETDVNNSFQVNQQFDDYQERLDSMFAMTIESLEWGANQKSLYGFDEAPLGDARLVVLEQLADGLTRLNFSGVVRIDTHVGNFCMTAAGPDGFQLADGGMNAASCDQIGVSSGEAYELGLRQSIAFANFVRLADERSAGQIRYQIVSHGNSLAALDYPATPESVSAATWNEIARQNNRVEFTLYPDGT